MGAPCLPGPGGTVGGAHGGAGPAGDGESSREKGKLKLQWYIGGKWTHSMTHNLCSLLSNQIKPQCYSLVFPTHRCPTRPPTPCSPTLPEGGGHILAAVGRGALVVHQHGRGGAGAPGGPGGGASGGGSPGVHRHQRAPPSYTQLLVAWDAAPGGRGRGEG